MILFIILLSYVLKFKKMILITRWTKRKCNDSVLNAFRNNAKHNNNTRFTERAISIRNID